MISLLEELTFFVLLIKIDERKQILITRKVDYILVFKCPDCNKYAEVTLPNTSNIVEPMLFAYKFPFN